MSKTYTHKRIQRLPDGFQCRDCEMFAETRAELFGGDAECAPRLREALDNCLNELRAFQRKAADRTARRRAKRQRKAVA